MRPLASRMSRLGTETAFEVLAKARALEAKGRDIVHLEIGEPDFDTPPAIVAAGVAALERGETHYTPSAGVVELREAITLHLKGRRGVRVDPGQVIVTPGAKPIMFYALLALLDDGDEAIYPDPGFPIYASMIDFAGARGVPLALREENAFQPDLDELRRLVTSRTKVLVLNSPNNPTGGILSREAVRDIAAIARERDLWVLTDEIYAELIYDGSHRSIAVEEGMAERTILLDGFSKTFAMTGWRLGYGVFPRPLVEPVTKLVTNSVSCTATFVQRAGAAALSAWPVRKTGQTPIPSTITDTRSFASWCGSRPPGSGSRPVQGSSRLKMACVANAVSSWRSSPERTPSSRICWSGEKKCRKKALRAWLVWSTVSTRPPSRSSR